jgi:hypothetical protein
MTNFNIPPNLGQNAKAEKLDYTLRINAKIAEIQVLSYLQ